MTINLYKIANTGILDSLCQLVTNITRENTEYVDLRRAIAGRADATIVLERKLDFLRQKEIARQIVGHTTGIESAKVSHNKITLRLTDAVIRDLACSLPLRLTNLFGLRSRLRGKRYLVDFCDPNANKPLHIGHLRNLALGKAITALLSGCGARVATQSVVGDIGRNVCEAIAGYKLFGGGSTPESAKVKEDIFVGRLYAAYVRGLGESPLDESGPDAPIARELQTREDLAQTILLSWMSDDADVRNTWKDIIRWALDGQARTLHRLNVKFDRLLLESDGYNSSSKWVSRGLDFGIFNRTPDGAIAFRTGREDYPQLLLVRSDGFPTEHMRALAIWAELQSEEVDYEACIHVMGREWLITTIIREDLVSRLSSSAVLNGRYIKIPHEMVTVGGSKMKSSDGQVILIDELLDNLSDSKLVRAFAEKAQGHIANDMFARLLLAGWLLSFQTDTSIEFSYERISDRRSNPAILWAEAMADIESLNRASMDVRGEVSEEMRFAVLQVERFPGFVSRAIESFDCCNLVRFLTRTAEAYLSIDRRCSVAPIFGSLFRLGADLIGVSEPIETQPT